MYGGSSCTEATFKCIRGGYAPPPVYYIDVTKLPEPPPGSDAEKIAKERRGLRREPAPPGVFALKGADQMWIGLPFTAIAASLIASEWVG
jgi:hypothetical protein